MPLQKVVAIQDGDSNWHVIPKELTDEFYKLDQEAGGENYDKQEEFMDKFGKYRTGGDLNNIQLYAEI